jgi:mono/diheme cytochrome c family protein
LTRRAPPIAPLPVVLLPGLLLALLIGGCDSGQGALGKAEPGAIPAYPQRPGDPVKGRDALLNRAPVTCGLPIRAYRKSAGSRAMAPGLALPGRTGANAELPYGLTAHTADSGVELVTANCLLCHAAPLDGRLVVGLGNAFLDLTQDPLLAAESAGAQVSGKAERAEWRGWADRLGAVADYTMTDTVGVNSANNLTLALMAHRDPQTLAWSAKPLIEPPPERPLPVAVPPWWNMRKKHAMFYNGEGRGDHVAYMMLASTLCTDSVEEARAIDAWFVDVRAYLATLEPPPYPHPIDWPLAELGQGIFRANCKRCHGTYGPEGRYPNLAVALGKVETDPELARAAYSDSDRFLDWFRRSFYGERASPGPVLGYVAPPLDGVWATAPYLHNDSVPTLADLLESPARPAYWEFARTPGGDPVYDRARVGWSYRTLAAGKSAAMGWAERNRIYDSTQKGYGNGGHDFADGLAADERRALIEYLKTL